MTQLVLLASKKRGGGRGGTLSSVALVQLQMGLGKLLL